MINVSSAFKEALANDKRDYVESAVITLQNGTVLTLDNSDFWSGSFKIEDAVSPSADSFSALGSAIVNAATLTINNIYDEYSDYDFTNARVIMSVGLTLTSSGTTWTEMLTKGTYTVEEATYNGALIELSMLDNMAKFDRPYSESTLIYPATCDTIIRNACTVCGVSLATSSMEFPYKSTVIDARPDDEAITFREVIAYVSAICGCFARCSASGELELKWFDQSSLESAIGNDSADIYRISALYDSKIGVDDIVITGVRVEYQYDNEGEEETRYVLDGNEGYVIGISGNPFITYLNSNTIATRLGLQLIGLRFRKVNVSHSSDPSLEAGDVAMVIDQKGNSYPILITQTNFTVGNPQTTVCGAEAPARKSASRYSTQTKAYVEMRNQLYRQKTTFELALANLSDRIENAQGLFETQVPQGGGSVITYMHDKPELSESDIQIMISNVGVTVTANGTDPEPTWYGLTVNGELIASILNVIGINASWINTGQLVVTKDGYEVMFVDVDTGTVRISGNSISITSGDVISSAIADAQSGAMQYTDAALEDANDYADSILSIFSSEIYDDIEELQAQIDGQVETYYYNYEPTMSNYPADEWTTQALKEAHQGDLFYNTTNGHSYRFLYNDGVWGWVAIADTDVQLALEKAAEALNVANTKRRIFIVEPTPPYDVGDTWMQGADGDILTCTTPKTAGASFKASDWSKLNRYANADEIGLRLETPFAYSNSGQTANFTAYLYRGMADVSDTYPSEWFTWILRNETGEEKIGEGRTMSLNRSECGYGSTVVCRFETYDEYYLTTSDGAYLTVNDGRRLKVYTNR